MNEDYVLQSTEELRSPTVWNDSLNSPGVVNGRFATTNVASGAYRFFRLRREALRTVSNDVECAATKVLAKANERFCRLCWTLIVGFLSVKTGLLTRRPCGTGIPG